MLTQSSKISIFSSSYTIPLHNTQWNITALCQHTHLLCAEVVKQYLTWLLSVKINHTYYIRSFISYTFSHNIMMWQGEGCTCDHAQTCTHLQASAEIHHQLYASKVQLTTSLTTVISNSQLSFRGTSKKL